MQHTAVPAWDADRTIVELTVADVLSGRADTVILVNSLPRTASKYLQGILAASWRAALQRGHTPDKTDSRHANRYIWHAHGISEARTNELIRASEGPGTESGDKVDRHLAMRDIVLSAPRRIVITVIRNPYDRYVSEYVLRNRHRHFWEKVDADICRSFLKFADDRVNYDLTWKRENIFDTFRVPEFFEDSIPEWLTYQTGNLIYLIIRAERLDGFLREFLFSLMPEDVLAERSHAMGFTYGITNRNSSVDRSLAGMKERVRALVTRDEFERHLDRPCVQIDGRRFGIDDALRIAVKRPAEQAVAIFNDVIAADPGNLRAQELLAQRMAD